MPLPVINQAELITLGNNSIKFNFRSVSYIIFIFNVEPYPSEIIGQTEREKNDQLRELSPGGGGG